MSSYPTNLTEKQWQEKKTKTFFMGDDNRNQYFFMSAIKQHSTLRDTLLL